MSQHPSLRMSDKDKKQRSVLKRHERVKTLKEKEKWEEDDSVFGLPKVKVTRFKIKKEKAVAPAEGAEDVEGAQAPGAAPAAPAGKEGVKAPAKDTGKAPAKDTAKTAAKDTAKAPGSDAKKETKK